MKGLWPQFKTVAKFYAYQKVKFWPIRSQKKSHLGK